MIMVHDPVISGFGKLRILISPWHLKILYLPAIVFHLSLHFLQSSVNVFLESFSWFLVSVCMASPPLQKFNTTIPLSRIYLFPSPSLMPSVLPAQCAVPFFQFVPKFDSHFPSQKFRFLGIDQAIVL